MPPERDCDVMAPLGLAPAFERGVDLAAEVGASFAVPPCGIALPDLRALASDGRRLHPAHAMSRDDGDLLALISTGYVACGTHAGDAVVMGRTVRAMADRGIAIGANPSYPDLFGFGQRPVDLDDVALGDLILAQIAQVAALALRAGARLTAVRCHGALAHDVAYDERTAQVVSRTLCGFDPALSLVCMAASPGARVAWDSGVTVVQEVCLDRAYDRAGRIIEPDVPDAAMADLPAAVARVLSVTQERRLSTMAGGDVRVHADSFCLNGDTPNAAAIARAVADTARQHGIAVRAPRNRR